MTPVYKRSDPVRRAVGGVHTPLYHQIYLVLRGKIMDGEYADGAILPGEEALAASFGVSRITARRALAEIAAEGLAVRARGRGTSVRYKGRRIDVRGSVDSLLAGLKANARNRVRVVEYAMVPAAPEPAAALGLDAGATVLRAARLRYVRGHPFSHLLTFVPEAIGRSITRRDLARRPLYALLARAGAAIASADQKISATLADARLAAALDVAVGAPLLRITRVLHAADGRPVEYLVACHRPDRYQYCMRLTREPGSGSWE